MNDDTKMAAVLFVALGGGLYCFLLLASAAPETLGPPYLEVCSLLLALVSSAMLTRPVARWLHGDHTSSRALAVAAALALPLAAIAMVSARITNARTRSDVHDVVCRVEGQSYAKAHQLVAFEVLCPLPDGTRARNSLSVEPGDPPFAERIPLLVARGSLGVWYVVERRTAQAHGP